MSEIYQGRWFVVPFLRLVTGRRILFTDTGVNIPSSVHNDAYRDSFERRRRLGSEPLNFQQGFDFLTKHLFTASIASAQSSTLELTSIFRWIWSSPVTKGDKGDLCLKTAAQRLFVPWLTGRFPQLLSGTARVRESYNDTLNRFEIDVDISNPIFGTIFGYRGWFDLEMIECDRESIPTDAFPLFETKRE